MALDPSNVLWERLVFPWCNVPDLFRLRAVCRGFRAQTDNSARLWLPLTMELPYLRHDERIQGWRGLQLAMHREKITRTNCSVGRCTLGPAIPLPHPTAHLSSLVAGHIVAFYHDGVQVFDVETGALLAKHDVDVLLSRAFDLRDVIMDRWIPFYDVGGRGLLLDCVTAQMEEFVLNSYGRAYVRFSIAGACFTHQTRGRDAEFTVVRVVGNIDGSTTVWQVARVQLAHSEVRFALCEHGRSYLQLDDRVKELQLIDLESRQAKRVFVSSESLLLLRSHG